MSTDKLLKALKENKIIIGTDKSLQLLLTGDIDEVYLASNCPPSVRSKIKSLAESSKVSVTELAQTSEEIGALCKKPFSIAVVSTKKSKEK